MNRTAKLLLAAAALALAAAPLRAQEPEKPAGARPIDAKTKNVAAATAGGQEVQVPAPAPAEAKQEEKEPRAGQARAHKEILKPVAFEEARYRKRLAQLDRIEQIARDKQNEKLLAEVAELRARNDEHHQKRMTKLRATHGEQQVDAALAFLEKHGKGKPVMPPKNSKAREAAKNQAGEKAEDHVKQGRESTERAKEKAKEELGEKP